MTVQVTVACPPTFAASARATLQERSAQLAALQALFDDWPAGEGRIALISGPLGSGKTELLRAFVAQAIAAGARHLGATGSPSGRHLPFGVLDQLMRSGIRSGLSADRLDDLLDGERLLPGEARKRNPAQLLHRMCLSLLDLVEDSANPLIVSVDDVEFADADTVRCLSLLARRLRTGRLLILLSASSESQYAEALLNGDMPGVPLLRRIQLPLLTPAGAESVLARRLGPDAAQRLAHACHALSGGSPLLLSGIAEDNCAPDGLVPAEPVVGKAYQQAVLSCVYRGGRAALAVAREIAVLGSGTAAMQPGVLSGLGTHAAQRAVALLNASGVLKDGRFRHPQARAAVLTGLSGAERAELHGQAADLLFRTGAPIPAVAHHLLAAERPAPRYGVPVLQQAAEIALAEHNVQLALDCLRLALRTESDPNQEAVTTAMLARAEWRIDPAVALRREPVLRSAIPTGALTHQNAYAQVRSLLWFGNAPAAVDTLNALQAFGIPRDPNGAARFAAARMFLSICYPETPSSLAEQPDGEPAPGAASAGLGNDSAAYATSASCHLRAPTLLTNLLRAGPSPRLAELAASLLRRYQLSEGNFSILTASLMTLVLCDRLSDAEQWSASLLAEVESANSPTWLAQLTAVRAEISLRRHSLLAAMQQARQALTIIPYDSWGVAVGLPLSTLIQAHAALGTPQDAVVAECLKGPWPDTICQTPAGLLVLHARGRMHLAHGQARAALDDFEIVGELAVQGNIDIPALLPWRTDAARAHLLMNRTETARELAAAQFARCSPDQPRARALTLRVLAAASAPAERPRLLEQALEALQGCEDPRQLPHPLYDMGRSLQVLHRPTDPRDTTQDRGAGQRGRSAEARAAMEWTAAPPGAVERVDADRARVLSEAEQRVASLAARGYSNRQIAGRLFVTISTVEQHLTRVYRKLNVKRRSELALALPADVALQPRRRQTPGSSL
ncbi:AAA family ATPase [Streptomyces sp. NBC_00210]|uniref:helix-turn-helix transcriptional regulator n=1 Tax=Streptomyces sp. NBC_00210 TaxID=2903636 RepID=UPI0032464078